AAGLGLLLPVALAACGTTATGADPGAATTRIDGGTIVYAHDQEPPCLYGGWVQQAYLSRQVLDSLVSQAEDGEIVPWLATGWEVSEDQLTWTFTLAEGVTFTDGTVLDAEAVSRNLEYWLEEGGNSTVAAYLARYYADSRAADPLTLEITLTEPYAPLLSALSQAYFGIQSPASLEREDEEICEAPIGSGPFVVEGWDRGDAVHFTRNPDYDWAPENALHQGPAYVDGIEWRFVHDPVARFGALGTGEAHVIYDVPTPQWGAAEAQFDVQQYITPGRPVALGLNTVEGPFADRLVRQAFAFGTDREAAVTSAFHGVIPYEGNGSISQSTPGYDAEVADDYPYDLDRAVALLEEAGWSEVDAEGVRTREGERLEVSIVYGAGSIITAEGTTVLQNIQDQAKAAGFAVTLVPATREELFSGKYSGPDTYDAKPGYWTSPTAGVLHITFRQHLEDSPNFSNSSFYNDPELEEIIVEANSTLDPAEQDRLYGQAQQIISDQAASIGLYTQTTSIAVGPELRDVWLEDSQGEPVFHDAHFVE
ncbi:ABC transporter substrate-binding protein, partial [Actinotalea sp. C106]|uniref:ABC transporter substrate-binding protein n=1 Tax=Actinotalea sp. C106 TaxID=2908644 RepID=UPI0027E023C0